MNAAFDTPQGCQHCSMEPPAGAAPLAPNTAITGSQIQSEIPRMLVCDASIVDGSLLRH